MTLQNSIRKISFPKPEQKDFTINCEKHGKQSGFIVLKPNGEWTQPFCRECEKEKREREEKQIQRFDRFTQISESMKNLLLLSYMQEKKYSFKNYETDSPKQEKEIGRASCRERV